MLVLVTLSKWISTRSVSPPSSGSRSAKTFLLVQNLGVCLNCVLLALYFTFREDLFSAMGAGSESWLPWLMGAVAIFIAAVANLASTGSKIVVEKDWIVVIAGGDDDSLARLNMVFRTIDLVCLTATPVLAGILFSYTSYQVNQVH